VTGESPEAAIAGLRATTEATAKQVNSLEHAVTAGFATVRVEMATKEGQNFQAQMIASLERSLNAEVTARRENDGELRSEIRARDEATNRRITDKIRDDEAREDERTAEQDRRRYQFYTAIVLSVLSPIISAAVAAWIVGGSGALNG
jgi:hypothetical protein